MSFDQNLYIKLIHNFKLSLKKFIGSGEEGMVFSLAEDKSKVVKFVMYFDDENFSYHEEVKKRFHIIMDENNSSFANVFDFKIEKYKDERERNYIFYYYIMEKLKRCSNEDSTYNMICALTHSFYQQEYLKIPNSFDVASSKYKTYPDFHKVISFYKKIKESKIKHDDMLGNIMIDESGNYKLIDFDMCTNKKD